MTEQEIIDFLGNAENANSILPKLEALAPVKSFFDNKAEAIYKSKINEEISKVHSKYDEDMFSILGEKPAEKDGVKTKTYEHIKTLYSELKGLREQKDSLSKDSKVAELTAKIEELKKNPDSEYKKMYDNVVASAQQKEKELTDKINEQNSIYLKSQKESLFSQAVSELKFDNNTSEAIRKVVLESEKNRIFENSKIIDGKLVLVDDKGETLLDETYKPMSVQTYLSKNEAVSAILLKDGPKGGGAKTVIGKVNLVNNPDGKQTKQLELSGFKSKLEFQEVAEKALIESGVLKTDPLFTKLKDEAYVRYEVSKLS